jgi:hypothetical protein
MRGDTIQDYMLDLRKELVVRGVGQGRLEEILLETQAHLEESGDPSNFASPKAYAKAMADELGRRKFTLWPAITSGLCAWALAYCPDSIGRTHVILIGFVVFMVGFHCRKFQFGQFFALFGVQTVIVTAYYILTCFPIPYGDPWDESLSSMVPKSERVTDLAILEKEVASRKMWLDRFDRSAKVFSGKNVLRQVPADLLYKGHYPAPMLLEGLAEGNEDAIVHEVINKPDGTVEQHDDTMYSDSFAQAIKDWNPEQSRFYKRGLVEQLSMRRVRLNSLLMAPSLTLEERFQPCFHMASLVALYTAWLGFLAGNFGWLIYCSSRLLQRMARRRRLGVSGLAQ